jgi:hypothetical protein
MMKRMLLAATTVFMILALIGCGGGGGGSAPFPTSSSGLIEINDSTGVDRGSVAPLLQVSYSSMAQPFGTQILSDPAIDGDIKVPLAGPIIVTEGMSFPTVQSVFAGIDPSTGDEYRAFLDFPLTSIPLDAFILSATLDIFIDNIFLEAPLDIIPIRIDLVSFPPPLIESDFNSNNLATIFVAPIISADLGNHVFVDVTSLMVQAQNLGLSNFQIRIVGNF